MRSFILSLIVLLSTQSLWAEKFYEDTRVHKNLKKLCKENPHKSYALILHKESKIRGSLNAKGECKRPRCIERIRYVYRLKEVNQKNLDSSSEFIGKYFRILEGQSEKPVPLSCENLRANNVYFHMNYIHEIFLKKMIPYFPKELTTYLEKHYPIDIRINVDELNAHAGRFEEGSKMTNFVTTVCGYLDKEDDWNFVEKPEVLFYRPGWKKGSFSFAPLCFIDYFKNQKPCSSDPSIDYSLSPGTIFHEYTHLLTDPFLDQCYGNILGEALGVFTSLAMNPEQRVGYGLPAAVTHQNNKVEFSSELKPYTEGAEDFDRFWLSEKGHFGFEVLGKYYKALQSKANYSQSKAFRFVLKSAFHFREFNGEEIPQIKHLPKVMESLCKKEENSQACMKAVESVNTRYF